jgi:lipopolysaccharide biosynthesis glycosyltransferase
MNILVSTNPRYLSITETMLFSLSGNTARPLVIWCLNSHLKEKEKAAFHAFLRDKCGIHDLHFLDMGWLKDVEASLPLNIRHISIETYYRLFAQFVLPRHLDRILWLDSDIIIKASIDKLYDQAIEGVPLVAFPNMGEADRGGNIERLGLPHDYTYFNAGVMLLNLEYLRNNTTIEDLISFCVHNCNSFKQQDQDALNLLYHDYAKVINDQRFNCMVNASGCFSAPDIADQASVIHYAGWQKPWKIKWQNTFSCYWWDVKREEGLSYKDHMVLAIGNLWRILRLNTLERWLLSPYYWLLARIKPYI